MGGPCRIAAQTEVGAAKLPKYCCGPPGLLSRLHMVTSPRHIQKERFARPFLFRSFLLMKYKIRCVKLLVRTIRTSISKQFTYAVIEVTALDLPWGVMQYPPPPSLLQSSSPQQPKIRPAYGRQIPNAGVGVSSRYTIRQRRALASFFAALNARNAPMASGKNSRTATGPAAPNPLRSPAVTL